MIDSKYDWDIKINNYSNEAKQLAEELKLSPLVASILIGRGYNTKQLAEKFLYPKLTDFNDPFLLHDVDKAIDKVQETIMNDELITVYGDYDADGITSTTIMYEALSQVGAKVNYYIPNRFNEGYGPNKSAFENIINNGTKLIITVDNGIAGNEAIDYANELGCSVIVTDHHEMPEVLPNAYALVHPRVGDQYPFGQLSGAGVAFKFVWALLEEFPADLIELAAIGTVADVVSLTDENRVLVSYGLKALKQTQRLGLLSLIKKAGVNLENLNEQDIGFNLAPRLNSLGRMGDASIGVELLSTLDEKRAKELAKFADDQNTQRKELGDQVLKSAIDQIENNDHVDVSGCIVVASPGWHEGILGIVAGRLVDKYHRPTIVLSIDENTNIAKGSGRSINQFDLFKAIDPIRDELVSFGGHHSAIGISLDSSKLDLLRQQLNQDIVHQNVDLTQKNKLTVATKIKISEIDKTFIQQIKLLAPFGEDNLKPTFEFNFKNLSGIKAIGKLKDHLKFEMIGRTQKIAAISFGSGKYLEQLQTNSNQLQIVGELGENTWKNKTSLQIMVDDLKLPSVPYVDMRTNQLYTEMFNYSGLYVFFNRNNYKILKDRVYQENQLAVMYDNLPDKNAIKHLIFVDCPDKTEDLLRVLTSLSPAKTTFLLYKKHMISKIGMPDRNQYAKLFKFVNNYKDIDLHNNLTMVANKINIYQESLIFMIKVFDELGFIKIDNQHLMNLNPDFQKKSLDESLSYQLRKQQIQTERELLVPSTSELFSFIQNYQFEIKEN